MADTSIFEIDMHQLDREWVAQPRLYATHARKLAKAKQAEAETKAMLDVVRAELDLSIRKSPIDFDLEKPTEGSITATILVQKEYKTALNQYNAARYTVGLVQGVVDALDHRKKALENLVHLHGQNYFATPRAKGVSSETVEHLKKTAARGRARINK